MPSAHWYVNVDVSPREYGTALEDCVQDVSGSCSMFDSPAEPAHGDPILFTTNGNYKATLREAHHLHNFSHLLGYVL